MQASSSKSATTIAVLVLVLTALCIAPSYSRVVTAPVPALPEEDGPTGLKAGDYGFSGHWDSFASTAACDGPGGAYSRVCAEWVDDDYTEQALYCCVDPNKIYDAHFYDCLEVVYAGPRPSGGLMW